VPPYTQDTGAVTDCRLIDFANTYYGAATLDILTYLLVCTDKELRGAHWDSLLKSYHSQVQDTLRAAGVKDPDKVFSWNRFQEQLRLTSFYGLCMTPFLLHCMHAEGETIQELKDVFTCPMDKQQRTVRLKATPKFKKHVADVIEDMVTWGWISS
ncbi:EcKinase 9, partial [Frankliniella occidentalis]